MTRMRTYEDRRLGDQPLRIFEKSTRGIWVSGAIILVIVLYALFSFASNPNMKWDVVWNFLFNADILSGLVLTIWLTAACMAISFVLGIVLALMNASHNPVLRSVAGGYLWLFRGTPVLVQLLIWFNLAALYPELGIPGLDFSWNANQIISPLTAAIIGLSLNEAAYMSEIIRSGLKSVDKGQIEAGRALAMPPVAVFRRITLPQAMRVIVPPTSNEVISMLKYTSLVSVIALPELLYSAQIIASQNFQVIPLLFVATIWYLTVTSILSLIQFWLERVFGASDRAQMGKGRKLMRRHA